MDIALPTWTPVPRADFPVLSRRLDGGEIVYLDNAATTLKPTCVIDEIVRYYTATSANIHRGKHYLSEEASLLYERTRSTVAQYLGTASNEIVLLTNASQALNLVAAGLEIEPRDLVLVGLEAHHSAMLPWRRRARVEHVRMRRDGAVDLDHYHDLLKRRPKVVVLTHCSNVTGLYLPLEAMAAAAKEIGAIVVVDAAQSMPHRRIRVRELPVDFVAFSGHKMLGPSGTGVLYGRHELLMALDPPTVGGGSVDWVDTRHFDLRKVPHRFEVGTPNIAGVIGLRAAVDYLDRIGAQVLEDHDRSLGQVLVQESRKRPYLSAVGDVDELDRAALVSVTIDGVHNLSDVARMLSDSYGIMCRSGHMCAQPLVDGLTPDEVLRISAYVYNTEDELRRVFECLDEISETLTH